jgi:hypothetical protein
VPARYLQVPSADPRPVGSSSATNLFGISLGPAARDSLMIGLLIFGTGAFIFGLLIADGLGLGPRHPLWRQRVTRCLKRGLHWSPVTNRGLPSASSAGHGERLSWLRRRI